MCMYIVRAETCSMAISGGLVVGSSQLCGVCFASEMHAAVVPVEEDYRKTSYLCMKCRCAIHDSLSHREPVIVVVYRHTSVLFLSLPPAHRVRPSSLL